MDKYVANEDLEDEGRGWEATQRALDIERVAKHASPLDMLTWDGRKSGEERQYALPERMYQASRVVVLICDGRKTHAEEVIGQAAEVQPGSWELDSRYGEVAQITKAGRRRSGTAARADLDEYARRLEATEHPAGVGLLDGIETASDHRTATFLCPQCGDRPRAREGERINRIMGKIVEAMEPTTQPEKHSAAAVWEVGSWVLHERG